MRDRVRSRVAIARLLPLAGTPLTAATIACNLVVGLAPVGFVVATSVVVGRLPGAVAGRLGLATTGACSIWAIAAAGILLAVQQGVSPVLGVLGERISRRVDGIVRDRLAAASVGSPTIAALEDQELLGHLSEAGGGSSSTPSRPGRAVSGLVALINRYVPVVGRGDPHRRRLLVARGARDPRRLDADPVRDAPRARGRERDVAREHVEHPRVVVLPRARARAAGREGAADLRARAVGAAAGTATPTSAGGARTGRCGAGSTRR